MDEYKCPHCGGPLGRHYHFEKDVCCLACSGLTLHEFEKAKQATDPKYMTEGKDHATWPSYMTWPFHSKRRGLLVHGAPTAGKSFACGILRSAGIDVVDTDDIIREKFGIERFEQGGFHTLVEQNVRWTKTVMRDYIKHKYIIFTNTGQFSTLTGIAMWRSYVRPAADLNEIWYRRGTKRELSMEKSLRWTENDTWKWWHERTSVAILGKDEYISDDLPAILEAAGYDENTIEYVAYLVDDMCRRS